MKRTSAFTLLELLVVVIIIALLTVIIFPIFMPGRYPAKKKSCLSNVKQISLGILMYCQDYDEKMPHTKKYQESIFPYVKNNKIYQCPLVAGFSEHQGYALESRILGKNAYDIQKFEKTPMLWDSLNLQKNATDPGIGFAARHDGFGNIAFVDGHARAYQDAKGQALMFAPIVFEDKKSK
jgi:prepilin-type processing-associated H-X9-DG protein/prepilin-type N-terminal cleavage/methylation domain-containing protein